MEEEGEGRSCSKNSKNRGTQLVFSHGAKTMQERKGRRKKEEIQKLRAAHQIRGNARLKSLLGLRYESPFASRKTHARPKRAGQSAKSIIFSKWILGKEEIASNYALVSRRICVGGNRARCHMAKKQTGGHGKSFPRPEEVSFIRRRERD